MHIEGTNEVVYCIERDTDFPGSPSAIKDPDFSTYWSSLSLDARDGVTYVSMYAYPINTYGGHPHDAYAAAQCLIWEFVKGYRTLGGTLSNSEFFDGYIDGTPAESIYNQLAQLINSHESRPSFARLTVSAAQSTGRANNFSNFIAVCLLLNIFF